LGSQSLRKKEEKNKMTKRQKDIQSKRIEDTNITINVFEK